jgi:hypothetical protein
MQASPVLPAPPNPDTLLQFLEFNYETTTADRAAQNAFQEHKRLRSNAIILSGNKYDSAGAPIDPRARLFYLASEIMSATVSLIQEEANGIPVPHWKAIRPYRMLLAYTVEMMQKGFLVGT